MHLTEKEIDHLAKLAKLQLSDEKKQQFMMNMDEIINFLGQLNTTKDETPWKSEKEEGICCFDTPELFEDAKALLKNSQHQKGDFISVQTAIPS